MLKIKNKNLIPEQDKVVNDLKNKIEELTIKLEQAQKMLKHYQQ
tara:strand:+ start:259 stop:390 length:132 start_codon:yes stop_codon:yes gene_type:complete